MKRKYLPRFEDLPNQRNNNWKGPNLSVSLTKSRLRKKMGKNDIN